MRNLVYMLDFFYGDISLCGKTTPCDGVEQSSSLDVTQFFKQ